ncbi:YceI family protein [Pontibacter sp. JH31]|uniref:YceI family protein n=1 Tax=Pontibacter aquaedesilientis TaxID=2766980 RepID=A0ABR7XDM5_9BACT|nr:YceI family protein [Pontibacter aquaedesilientis]MBD1396389.1 YceI family protein [Pontibacter aquaedesilientis]
MKHYLFFTFSIILMCIFTGFGSSGQVYQDTFRQAKRGSTIGYTLEHPLHTVQGISSEVSSQLTLSQDGRKISKVEVRVPVRSFDSGNRRRDRDMLKVTEAERYPEVTFISSQITEQDGALAVTGRLTFHGITREIQLIAQTQWQGESLLVTGEFDISLEAYQIKRPSILTMKVKDMLQVRFRMVY